MNYEMKSFYGDIAEGPVPVKRLPHQSSAKLSEGQSDEELTKPPQASQKKLSELSESSQSELSESPQSELSESSQLELSEQSETHQSELPESPQSELSDLSQTKKSESIQTQKTEALKPLVLDLAPHTRTYEQNSHPEENSEESVSADEYELVEPQPKPEAKERLQEANSSEKSDDSYDDSNSLFGDDGAYSYFTGW